MTDFELSERICRALGIEPLSWICKNEWVNTLFLAREDAEEFGKKHGVSPVPNYPSVLEWPGFGRVEERLRERNMPFTMQHFTDPYPNRYGVRVNYMKTCHADTLPRALAMAILEWSKNK